MGGLGKMGGLGGLGGIGGLGVVNLTPGVVMLDTVYVCSVLKSQQGSESV